MFPVFSLMVLSETKAGYSVSHGTCMLLPILWAEQVKEKRKKKQREKMKERQKERN